MLFLYLATKVFICNKFFKQVNILGIATRCSFFQHITSMLFIMMFFPQIMLKDVLFDLHYALVFQKTKRVSLYRGVARGDAQGGLEGNVTMKRSYEGEARAPVGGGGPGACIPWKILNF